MKGEIREKFKIKRRYFGSIVRAEAERYIAEYFLAECGGYNSYLIYNSFGSEASTQGIISALLREGKQVFLPRVEGDKMVAVPYGELKRGAYGIMEPQGQPYSGAIGVTAVPLLAVNGRGFRLGYGGGYYDRFLKDNGTLKVGLGFAFQLTDEFEEDGWDEPLDSFICERGIYYFDKEEEQRRK